jgi:hypothetical protein
VQGACGAHIGVANGAQYDEDDETDEDDEMLHHIAECMVIVFEAYLTRAKYMPDDV